MKRKLRGWGGRIWKSWLGAKSVPTWTGLQTTATSTAKRRAVDGNSRKIGATSSPIECLHQCKVHMKRKIRRWGARIWKSWLRGKSAPTWTGLQTTAAAAVRRRAVAGRLRKIGVTSNPEECLHQWKLHMKRKLRGWGSRIWKSLFGTKSVPTMTGLQITASSTVQRRAVDGNLRKIGATSSPVQCLHQCKLHMKSKLSGWGARISKSWFGAKSVPT